MINAVIRVGIFVQPAVAEPSLSYKVVCLLVRIKSFLTHPRAPAFLGTVITCLDTGTESTIGLQGKLTKSREGTPMADCAVAGTSSILMSFLKKRRLLCDQSSPVGWRPKGDVLDGFQPGVM